MRISIKYIKNYSILGRDEPRISPFLFINVEKPTIRGVLTFISRKISFSGELSMIFFIMSGPVLSSQCLKGYVDLFSSFLYVRFFR